MKTNKLNTYITSGLLFMLCSGINVAHAVVIQSGSCRFASENKTEKLLDFQKDKKNITHANVVRWNLLESEEDDPTKRKLSLKFFWFDNNNIENSVILRDNFCVVPVQDQKTQYTNIALTKIKKVSAGGFIIPHKGDKANTIIKENSSISFEMKKPKENLSKKEQLWRMKHGIMSGSSFSCVIDYPDLQDPRSFHRSIPMPMSPTGQPPQSPTSAMSDNLDSDQGFCITSPNFVEDEEEGKKPAEKDKSGDIKTDD